MISRRYITQYIKQPSYLLMLMMLASCFGEPEFPLEPEIEFAWIENYTPTELNDSVYIALTFRDGDGDLGLSEDDVNGPYAPYEEDKLPEDTVANKYHNNYFVSILRKEDDGVYRPVVFEAEQDFNGRYPKLNDSGRDRPLEGELRYGIVLYYDGVLQSPLNKGDSIKFTINIADRALNESNEIITAGIEVGTPKGKDEEQEETATPTD